VVFELESFQEALFVRTSYG